VAFMALAFVRVDTTHNAAARVYAEIPTGRATRMAVKGPFTSARLATTTGAFVIDCAVE
jgi:hypothetical protein